MIAVAVKAPRIKSAVGIVIMGGVFFLIILFLGKVTEKDALTLMNAQERMTYLTELGYAPAGEERALATIIPAEWNDTYTEYNNLQKTQGFDLSHHKGKEVTRYIFRAGENEEELEITLILSGDELIGADAYSYEKGEMMSLLKTK